MGEIATTWQLIRIILLFLHTFCWLRLPKEIFLKCWRCKICKDRMLQQYQKQLLFLQKVFNINLWQKIISINAQIKKRQNQGFWNLLKEWSLNYFKQLLSKPYSRTKAIFSIMETLKWQKMSISKCEFFAIWYKKKMSFGYTLARGSSNRKSFSILNVKKFANVQICK